MAATIVRNEKELAKKILNSEGRDEVIQTVLQTNEQVIARVTDGIYRQPASALRELISNAYDADATRVVIKTDAPRFERITIEDNGRGMSPEVLAHLLFNIGGSAKRNLKGDGLLDVDDYLSSQPEIMEEMIVAMSDLLTSARYDITRYRTWAGV